MHVSDHALHAVALHDLHMHVLDVRIVQHATCKLSRPMSSLATGCVQARLLSVEDDMKPVVAFLRQKGLSDKQVVKVFSGHPPVLGYDPEKRLAPVIDYLRSVGVDNPVEVRMQLHNRMDWSSRLPSRDRSITIDYTWCLR